MLQQTQLLSLLDRVLGQSARLRLGDTQAMYHCPFCKENKKIPKLEICLSGKDFQHWHCWICNEGGTLLRSLFRKVRVNKEFYTELYKITKDSSRIRNVQSQEQSPLLPKEFLPLSIPRNDVSLEYGNAISYLKGRGVTRDDILRYNMGYCEEGDYRHRIVIPSYDKDGNLNFFSARTYYDGVDYKYMLSEWSKDIIGFELFINWNEPVTLTEGAFDAIAIKRNAIPLFGTLMSDTLMLSLIENKVKRVNIVLDNDALKKAIDMFERIEELKVQDIDVHLIKLEDKDPSVLGFNKINDIIASSNPLDFAELISLKINL